MARTPSTSPPDAASPIDLDTLRLLASHWLRDDRTRADEFASFNPGLEDSPGNNAQRLIAIEDTIDEPLGAQTLAEVGMRAGMTFDAGFEFGLAAAVAIISEPFTNPQPRLASAIATARSEIADIVKNAQADAELTASRPESAVGP